jgi:hypothetical protein
MARVACTLRARIGPGSRTTVLSGGDGHVLVLGYSGKSLYMQDSILHISCGYEALAG